MRAGTMGPRPAEPLCGPQRRAESSHPASPPPHNSGNPLARGPDRPEEPVALVVGAGGEEERVGRPVVGRSLTELERPQAVDGEHLPFARPELTDELERPVQLRLERADLPVAEVPDEQVAAEAAEAGRRHRKAPWRVQLAVRRDPGEQCAARVELVDEAQALASDVILPVGFLL